MSPFAWAALAVGLLASITDLRTKRIPNTLTLGAALAALIMRGWLEGTAGVHWGLLGWLVGLALLFPLFAMRGLGGGDVKLMAAFGAFVGASTVLWATLLGTIAGGILSVALATRHRVWGRTWANLGLMVTHWRVAGPGAVSGLTLEDSRSLRLAYAVPLTCGLGVALWLGK